MVDPALAELAPEVAGKGTGAWLIVGAALGPTIAVELVAVDADATGLTTDGAEAVASEAPMPAMAEGDAAAPNAVRRARRYIAPAPPRESTVSVRAMAIPAPCRGFGPEDVDPPKAIIGEPVVAPLLPERAA